MSEIIFWRSTFSLGRSNLLFKCWMETLNLSFSTVIYGENWSPPEDFGPNMDKFSMEFWSYSYKTVVEPFTMTQTLPSQKTILINMTVKKTYLFL